MLSTRLPIGYVVSVEGTEVVLNLNDEHRGQVAAHSEGIARIGQPSDFIGFDAGAELVVARILSVEYAEPKRAHEAGVGDAQRYAEPLRQMRVRTIGYLSRSSGVLSFTADEWRLPALGAAAFPLTPGEGTAIVSPVSGARGIRLGVDARTGVIPVVVPTDALLSKHVAVLGSTGQGKTNFIAGLVQQLVTTHEHPRIVVFDINGEYASAFRHLTTADRRVTVIGDQKTATAKYGSDASALRIPYYALGRHGLSRLLLPSDKSQMPAFRFAVERLGFVDSDGEGAGIVGGPIVMFDDCRPGDAEPAWQALEKLRSKSALKSNGKWPHMRALSCVLAEWYAVQKSKFGYERSAFMYGHVQSLVNRVRALIDDERFRAVVDVDGGAATSNPQSVSSESANVVNRIFGDAGNDSGFKVHIVDVSAVAQDLLPIVLGSLLEMFAAELFRRGPSGTHPTMLVLEEAHHYLRPLGGDEESASQALAYERLAKEGRKFGLSLLLSTQRPSEVSSTVLAQCSTWVSFRLTNELDQRTIATAAESGSSFAVRLLSGLPRGQALLLGGAISLPVVLQTVLASPTPSSADPRFEELWRAR